MANITPSNSTVKLLTPIGDLAAHILEFTGYEGLSELFEASLKIETDQPIARPEICLGQSLTLSLFTQNNTTQRYLNGFITSIENYHLTASNRCRYHLNISPALSLLEHDIRYRIFQNKNCIDIITQLLKPHRHISFNTSQLTKTYKKREYCVQHNESTLHFISRLLEEDCIFYYFKHKQHTHTLCLADSPHSYDTNILTLPYSNTAISGQYSIHSLSINHTCNNKQTQFSSNQPTLSAKQTISISHLNKPLELMITHIKHHYSVIPEASELSGTSSSRHKPITHTENSTNNIEQYHNECSAIPVNTLFIPVKRHQRPIMVGPETAVVLGTNNQTVNTDQYGRIKVQFHWNDINTDTEDTTCWLFMHHPQAGSQWGHHFIPRAGQEVLVNFQQGNADHPEIIGSLYNSNHMTHALLPQKKSHSGIKTQSIGNAKGYNSIGFDDQANNEQFEIHAQRNYQQIINHDLTSTIQGNQTTTIQQGDQLHTVLNKDNTLQAQSITLTVGNAHIIMNTSGIHFNADHIHLLAAGNGTARGIARVGDHHECPKYKDETLPHKGGPILKGSPDVFVNGKAVARVKDVAHCEHDKDSIKKGSPSILVNDLGVARLHDSSQHGGKIKIGSSNVHAGQYHALPANTQHINSDNDITIKFATIDGNQNSTDDQLDNAKATIQPDNENAYSEPINHNQIFKDQLSKQKVENINQISVE